MYRTKAQMNTVADTLTGMAGKEATIFRYNSFGFPVATKCRIIAARVESYAQYDASLVVHFIEKGKRKAYGTRVLPNDDLIVFAGHQEVKSDMFPTGSGVSLFCFSDGYKQLALASVSVAPIINLQYNG